MFRLIDRYVLKEIASASLLGLLVYTAIFIVKNFLTLADSWVKGTLTMADVGSTLVYTLPALLVLTVPMSVLLGVLIGFSRLSADCEITALRTTGISYFRLLKPTLVMAVVAMAVTLGLYTRLVPWANTQATELVQRAMQRVDLNREIRPGAWSPLAEGMDGAIFARGIDDSNPDEPWMTDADIVIVDRAKGEARHYHARRARIDRIKTGDETGRLKFVFKDLRTILWKPDATGETPKITEASSGDHLLAERRMAGTRQPADIRRIDKGVRNMTIPELRDLLRDLDEMDRIEQLKKSDPRAAALMQAKARVPLVKQVRERLRRLARMEVHKKFAFPVACLVFALIGMPLGISTRRGGRPASFAISIAVVIVWWIIHNAGSTWCLAERLSPAAGAWLPNILLGLIAMHALFAQRRQQSGGIYRVLRDGFLLTGLVMSVLTGVFLWERHDMAAAGKTAPPLALWVPILAVVFLAAHGAFALLREPLSRRFAELSEAFRRPRTEVPEEPDTFLDPPPVTADAAGPSRGSEEAALASPREERQWMRRGRLERLRGALVFAFLATVVFCVVEAFQHDDGPISGARALLMSWEPLALAVLGLGCIGLQIAGVRIVSTLDWWIFSSLTRQFALVMTSMVAVYVVFQYLELADTILRNKVPASTVLSYYWHLFPRMCVDVLPFATMVATLVTFGMMSKFNETTAVRCGGVSIWRAVMPAVLLGTVLSSGAFLLNDYVLPESNQRVDDLRREMSGQPQQRRSTARGFLMGSDGRSLYQFRSVTSHQAKSKVDAQITGLTVLSPDESGRVTDLWTATDAVWRGDQWVLRNGWHALIDASNQVKVEMFTERPLARLERPDYFAAIRKAPNQMAFGELSRYVEEQGAAGFPTAALTVDLQKKLAFPAATLVLVLIGLPFAFSTGRRGALYGVGIALILAVLYLAIAAFFTAMGSAEYLPPMAAAWAPNALFGLAGVYMLLHVRT